MQNVPQANAVTVQVIYQRLCKKRLWQADSTFRAGMAPVGCKRFQRRAKLCNTCTKHRDLKQQLCTSTNSKC